MNGRPITSRSYDKEYEIYKDGINSEKDRIIDLIDNRLKRLLITRPTNFEQTIILESVLKELNPDYKRPSQQEIKALKEMFYADIKLPH